MHLGTLSQIVVVGLEKLLFLLELSRGNAMSIPVLIVLHNLTDRELSSFELFPNGDLRRLIQSESAFLPRVSVSWPFSKDAQWLLRTLCLLWFGCLSGVLSGGLDLILFL